MLVISSCLNGHFSIKLNQWSLIQQNAISGETTFSYTSCEPCAHSTPASSTKETLISLPALRPPSPPTLVLQTRNELPLIISRLASVLGDAAQYKSMLACTGDDAQRLLDMLQSVRIAPSAIILPKYVPFPFTLVALFARPGIRIQAQSRSRGTAAFTEIRPIPDKFCPRQCATYWRTPRYGGELWGLISRKVGGTICLP